MTSLPVSSLSSTWSFLERAVLILFTAQSPELLLPQCPHLFSNFLLSPPVPEDCHHPFSVWISDPIQVLYIRSFISNLFNIQSYKRQAVLQYFPSLFVL